MGFRSHIGFRVYAGVGVYVGFRIYVGSTVYMLKELHDMGFLRNATSPSTVTKPNSELTKLRSREPLENT